MGGWAGIGGTILGGAIGALPGGGGIALGAEIGGTIGTIVDALTMKPPFRPGDSRWVGSPYGSPIPRVWNSFRIDAPIVWALRNSDGTYLFEHDAGGKKGPATAHYWASFLVMVAQTGFTYPNGTQSERPIQINRVLAADKVIYLNGASYHAWQTSPVSYNSGDYVTGSDNKIYFSLADANSGNNPVGGPSNWWALGQITTLNVAPVFHPGTGESVFTQAVDSFIATHQTVANTQAFRGFTNFLLENFDCFDIGNGVPQSLVVEGTTTTIYTLAEILGHLAQEVGLSPADYDFSGASSIIPGGFMALAQSSAQDLINNLLSVYPVDLVQIDGILKAVHRGGSLASVGSSGIVLDADLSAALNGEQMPDRLGGTTLADRAELHNQVRVGYRDSTSNFRQAYEIAHRNNFSSPNSLDVSTDIVMTPDEAAQAAGWLLDTEWTERGGTWPVYLPSTYSGLAPTDCVEVNDPLGILCRYRVQKVNFVQGRVQCDLVRDETETLIRYEAGDGGVAPITNDTTPVLTNYMACSPNVELSDNFATFPGFYVFACGHIGVRTWGKPPKWPGCDIYFTFDPPSNPSRDWVPGGTITQESVFGCPATTLASFGGPGYDVSDTFKFWKGNYQAPAFEGSNMEVEGVSKTEAENGQNWALLCKDWSAGVWEVLGVVGCTDNTGSGGNHYLEATIGSAFGAGLFRGLRGSDSGAANSNTIGQLAFGMSTSVASTTKVAVDASNVGATVYVRVSTIGMGIDDALNEQSFVIYGPTSPYTRNTAPTAPSSVTASAGTYSGMTENLTFTPEFTTQPGPQTYNWQSATSSDGVTWGSWSASTNLPGAFPLSFSTGYVKAQCQAVTGDGRTSAWVASSSTEYVAPPNGSTSNFVTGEVPGGTVNGVNATFTIVNTPIAGTLVVFVRGLRLAPSDFTVSGAGFTITDTTFIPQSGDYFYVDYQY